MFGIFGPIDLIVLYHMPVAFRIHNIILYVCVKTAVAAYGYTTLF